MSLSGRKRHGFVLALAIIATATIAACDSSPTQPEVAVLRKQQRVATMGDTSHCTRGWEIINGWYACL